MSTATAVASGMIRIIGRAFLAIWNSIGTLISWLYAICLSPFKVLITVVSWIMYPFIYSTSRAWEIFRGILAWFLEEFESLLLCLGVAVIIGAFCGISARLSIHVINSLFDAMRSDEDEKPSESRSSIETRSSAGSDFSWTEEDPLPPYHHRAGTGKPQTVNLSSLLRQTIHEEVEDSSS
ncbi:hypothetical protein B0T14DRAFT_510741 [Immersiella caudata]|uniref:Uncharacterized protein n=1 Tax=Immersiella caudata TaxID=314043 RepID=A0AA39X3P5_9PEZI|nr:hypothetical protein B0T14DRAFT_510741 [Immersiella caudata]